MENLESILNNRTLENDLNNMNVDLGLVIRVPCSNDEEIEFRKLRNEGKMIPTEIYGTIYMNETLRTHYRYQPTNQSIDDINRLLVYRQMKYLNTIKNCMIFFTVIAIFSILVSFLIFLGSIY